MGHDALQLLVLAIAVGWLQQTYRNSVDFIFIEQFIPPGQRYSQVVVFLRTFLAVRHGEATA
jgi:hypothetical protein